MCMHTFLWTVETQWSQRSMRWTKQKKMGCKKWDWGRDEREICNIFKVEKKERRGYRGKIDEIIDGRGEEGMSLLAWLLFTRISGAYVNLPSASHLSTHTESHTCKCMHTGGWHNVWVWAPDVFVAHFFSPQSVRLFVHLSVCQPACWHSVSL